MLQVSEITAVGNFQWLPYDDDDDGDDDDDDDDDDDGDDIIIFLSGVSKPCWRRD